MDIVKHGLKISVNIIIAAVISFFLCVSINIICSSLFTVETGYKAYVYENITDENAIAEYEYTYIDEDGDGIDDGVDTKKEEYEEQGYNVTIVKQRSSLTGVGRMVFLISSQILSFIMVIAFAGSSVYKQGFKDKNLVKTNHKKYDILRGFKIGFIANIPFILLYVLAVVMALGLLPEFRSVWYAILNSHFYPIITLIIGKADSLSQIGVWQYIVLFLLQLIVPVISGVSYILGFKEINLEEKIVYKRGEV